MTDIGAFYDGLIDKHGPNHKGLDTSSEEALEIRYKVLSEVCDFRGKTVLDVGCGLAGFYDYLFRKYLYQTDGSDASLPKYTGIDISERAVEEAKKLVPPYYKFELIYGDFCEYNPIDLLTGQTKKYDIVVAQGVFYKLPPTRSGYQKVLEMITKMIRLSNEAIAFCALVTWPFGPSNEELRLDPVMTLQYLRQFSPWLKVDMSYHAGDAMFVAYRDKR